MENGNGKLDKNIRISGQTKDMLDNFRIHDRETYDDVIIRLMIQDVDEASVPNQIERGLT